MPSYFYTAKSFSGQTETGVETVKDLRALAQSLKSSGLVLIKAVSQDQEKPKRGFSLPSFFHISATEKIMMTKNLSIMYATGLSMVKSFDILASQAKKQGFKKALQKIRDEVNKGKNLSEALTLYPNVFSELFCSMIKVGEESGTLDEVFSVLSFQLDKEHELKSKIQNAMVYPGLIVLTMMGVGVLIVTVVLPKLGVFFESMNAPIPIYTRIVLASGIFLSQNWYLLFLVPAVLAVFFWMALKTEEGKKLWDTFLLRLPLISPLVKKNNSALLIRSLSSLISAGVPLVKTLEITSTTAGNYYFKKALQDSVEKVKKGEKLSSALKIYQNIFPLGSIEMIEVGEETGKTSTILKKLADFYEREAASATEKLSVVIEPLLILVLGVVVGLFAFSIIMPMYSALGSIQ